MEVTVICGECADCEAHVRGMEVVQVPDEGESLLYVAVCDCGGQTLRSTQPLSFGE